MCSVASVLVYLHVMYMYVRLRIRVYSVFQVARHLQCTRQRDHLVNQIHADIDTSTCNLIGHCLGHCVSNLNNTVLSGITNIYIYI